MRLVDTHCHLNHDDYDDLPGVLTHARQHGLAAMIVAGYDLDSSHSGLALASRESDVFAAVGVHPHDAVTCTAEVLACLEEWLKDEAVVALGEIGLDYYYDNSPRDDQRRAFSEQLALARAANVPVIIHSRSAEDETLAILREEGVPDAGGVMHCFPGDMALADECASLGLRVGINGLVTFDKTGRTQSVARRCPLEWLLLETDAPYLAPKPKRGRTNLPGYLPHVARAVAALRNEPVEELAEATTANARELFGEAIAS